MPSENAAQYNVEKVTAIFQGLRFSFDIVTGDVVNRGASATTELRFQAHLQTGRSYEAAAFLTNDSAGLAEIAKALHQLADNIELAHASEQRKLAG